jgi:DNA-binding MarR family transcriptional regulator
MRRVSRGATIVPKRIERLTAGHVGNTLRIVKTTTPDPDLEEAMADAFGSSFVVVGHLTRLADAALLDWGLTTRQWLLLAVLARGFGGREASLSQAAAAYGSSRQNIKQIALGLEARGWVRLVADPLDGRTTRIALTDLAARFDSPEGQARGRAVLRAAFEGLGPDEIVAIRALLDRWVAALATKAPSSSITASRKG